MDGTRCGMRPEVWATLTPASILSGWKTIGGAFGASARVARQWRDQGAPVVMVTDSLPCAALPEMWEWLKAREMTAALPPPAGKDAPGRPERRETREGESGEGGEAGSDPAGRECPYCGEVGTLRERGGKWRCEACRQLFTAAEMEES